MPQKRFVVQIYIQARIGPIPGARPAADTTQNRHSSVIEDTDLRADTDLGHRPLGGISHHRALRPDISYRVYLAPVLQHMQCCKSR